MQRRSGYHFLRKKKNEGPYLGALWIYPVPNAEKGPKVKDSKESMEIIEAYDLFGSYNGAAQFVGCSPNTPKEVCSSKKCRTTDTTGSI